MKIGRILLDGEAFEVSVVCNGYQILGTGERAGTVVSDQDAVLLPPVAPGKILGVGWNFREHMKEMEVRRAGGEAVVPAPVQTAEEVPPPILFFKPPSSLIGHRDAIDYPKDATRVEYEGELAVAIARDTRRVTPEEAKHAVLGWTCANDVTERDLQAQDKQWWRAKGMETFAVAGPFLETEAPGPDAWIRTRVNGVTRQQGQVRDMFRDAYEIISLVSQSMTLQRGDLIMLGTPPGVGELKPGDEVEVEIEGVGYLSNPVVAEAE